MALGMYAYVNYEAYLNICRRPWETLDHDPWAIEYGDLAKSWQFIQSNTPRHAQNRVHQHPPHLSAHRLRPRSIRHVRPNAQQY